MEDLRSQSNCSLGAGDVLVVGEPRTGAADDGGGDQSSPTLNGSPFCIDESFRRMLTFVNLKGSTKDSYSSAIDSLALKRLPLYKLNASSITISLF